MDMTTRAQQAISSAVRTAAELGNPAVEPDHLEANRGLGTILGELRDFEAALKHTQKGYGGETFHRHPYQGKGKPVRLLVLDGNWSQASRLGAKLARDLPPSVRHVKLAAGKPSEFGFKLAQGRTG